METLAGDAMPPQPNLTGCSFASLDQAERDRLAVLLRPLPWIDGLITAWVIMPIMPEQTDELVDWLDFVWSQADENEIGKLTLLQTEAVQSQLIDNLCYVTNTLSNDPEAYQPYLGGFSDPMDAAASWANGFLHGMLLCHSTWTPLFLDQEALPLLGAIIGLIRDEDMPEDVRAGFPFRNIPPDRREQLRRDVVQMLPEVVVALHEQALGPYADFDPDEDDDLDVDETILEDPQEPYVRSAPKIGRNDPCPCGSGKKYKKCCLGKAEAED